jgi:hypothetical protein
MRWRGTKVSGAAVVYALAGDEPARDQSQNEPRDKTHATFRHENSAGRIFVPQVESRGTVRQAAFAAAELMHRYRSISDKTASIGFTKPTVIG